jgi:hypothetical protein
VNINFPSSASEGSNDHNTNNAPHIIGEEGALGSGENDFFDLGLRVEASDLSNLTLPETMAERSDLPAPDLGCRPAENDQAQPDVGKSDYIAPDVSALLYWSLLIEEFDLGSITLPETVLTSEDDALTDLSDLVGLLGDQDESLALDFAQVDVDAPVVASIGSVKPVTKDWTSQADPFIDSDWNPIIEEFYYTLEFG